VASIAVEPIVNEAVAAEARRGLTSTPKSLAPWLFYDEAGSHLFEQITALPEYYLTRTERALFATHADEIFSLLGQQTGCPTSGLSDVGIAPHISIAELGAGTAFKTGILLRALTHRQPTVLYQPIDISSTALEEARDTIEATIPGVLIRPQHANYVTDPIHIEREPGSKILALYIGSSIGNFAPSEARAILTRLRAQLQPGDALLLGVDLAPSACKSVATLLAAYNDAAGVTAAFNRNILTRLNRELGADFHPDRFAHRALWSPARSRIEMHLESQTSQTVHIPGIGAGKEGPAAGLALHFAPGETIHTENSYKFTPPAIDALLASSVFTPTRIFTDPQNLFAVALAAAL
jgi:dimethylhistidine N-methyltransferase